VENKNYPDAVMVPDSWKGSGNALEQSLSLVDHAEAILGVDRPSGERAWVRHALGGGLRFCTKDPQDTLQFPTGHARQGQDRYRWSPQDDGSVHGHLIEKVAKEAQVDAH
jgi:hypothetical protein